MCAVSRARRRLDSLRRRFDTDDLLCQLPPPPPARITSVQTEVISRWTQIKQKGAGGIGRARAGKIAAAPWFVLDIGPCRWRLRASDVIQVDV